MSLSFGGPAEQQHAFRWMLLRLAEVTDNHAEGQLDEVDKLRIELEARIAPPREGRIEPTPEWLEDLWDRFIFSVSGVRRGEEPANWDPPHEFRAWEFDAPKPLPLGYSKYHLSAVVPKGGGSSKHNYSAPPEPFHWDLTPVTQKGITYLTGKATVAELDAVCSVPQLPQELDSEETAVRVLDKQRGTNEWQRRLDPERVLAISNFISQTENIIANAVIVYVPECPAVNVSADGRIEIDPSKFLAHHSGNWTDHEAGEDQRPLWLIDGQHRVRGLAQSEKGIGIELPIIVFPPSASVGLSAKIFAEINTLQTKLTSLHTLFMQHRFSIPSHVRPRDFRAPWDGGNPDTWESRANHLAYECAAYLTSHRGGPLFGLIKLLDQNPGRQVHQLRRSMGQFLAQVVPEGWYLPTDV